MKTFEFLIKTFYVNFFYFIPDCCLTYLRTHRIPLIHTQTVLYVHVFAHTQNHDKKWQRRNLELGLLVLNVDHNFLLCLKLARLSYYVIHSYTLRIYGNQQDGKNYANYKGSFLGYRSLRV